MWRELHLKEILKLGTRANLTERRVCRGSTFLLLVCVNWSSQLMYNFLLPNSSYLGSRIVTASPKFPSVLRHFIVSFDTRRPLAASRCMLHYIIHFSAFADTILRRLNRTRLQVCSENCAFSFRADTKHRNSNFFLTFRALFIEHFVSLCWCHMLWHSDNSRKMCPLAFIGPFAPIYSKHA
jgi:hypothetical protein